MSDRRWISREQANAQGQGSLASAPGARVLRYDTFSTLRLAPVWAGAVAVVVAVVVAVGAAWWWCCQRGLAPWRW